MECSGLDHLAREGDQWRAVLKMVMKPSVSICGEFLD
jgi:hypothetical protein